MAEQDGAVLVMGNGFAMSMIMWVHSQPVPNSWSRGHEFSVWKLSWLSGEASYSWSRGRWTSYAWSRERHVSWSEM